MSAKAKQSTARILAIVALIIGALLSFMMALGSDIYVLNGSVLLCSASILLALPRNL
jgi:hypothetical protein